MTPDTQEQLKGGYEMSKCRGRAVPKLKIGGRND